MFAFLSDAEDDPIFGPHMRQMNNMMSSMMADPFGMFGGGMLGMGGNMLQQRHAGPLMPFMPTMPSMNMNRLLSGNLEDGLMTMPGSSYSSSTVVMSSGPNGRPQVISSTSSTKVGPNGVKETRKTLEDSRTGTKKMAIGHHIGERAHVIEREQNVLSGDQEERQEFINLDEEEVDEFDKEFQEKSGGYVSGGGRAGHPRLAPAPRLALPAPPPAAHPSATVRDVYSGPQPRRRHRPHPAPPRHHD